MKAEELIKLHHTEVRNDERLMRLYINFYMGAFSYKPNCVPCNFENDFNKLKEFLTRSKKNAAINNSTMEKFVIHAKHRNAIFSYFDKDANKVKRSYGYLLTDDFCTKYLTQGTPEQLAERAKQFKEAPDGLAPAADEGYVKSALKKLNSGQLNAVLVKEGLNPDDFANMGLRVDALVELNDKPKSDDAPPPEDDVKNAPDAGGGAATSQGKFTADGLRALTPEQLKALVADNNLDPDDYETVEDAIAALIELN